MDRVDEFVEAVTRRLRTDRELHMDVAHEVRAHLEDAAAEARAQGRSEEECLEAALRAFGDPDEVAAQLYEANRRRMRMHALGRWANRLVLVPAALAVALLLGSFTVRTGQIILAEIRRPAGYPKLFAAFDSLPLPAQRPGLTADEQFTFEHLTEGLADARQLVARYPDDPVLYAHYVRLLASRFHTADPEYAHADPPTEEEFQSWLAALDRGEQVEPDNAFYDYLKAALLMMRSSRLEDDAGLRFEYPDPNEAGKLVRPQGERVVILDAGAFGRAMAEVEEGMAKPHCTSHVADVTRLRESLWRPARTLREWWDQEGWQASMRLPHLELLEGVFKRLPARALALAEAGDADGAARLAQRMARPAVQMGADAGWATELIKAYVGFQETAGQAPEVLKLVGRPAEAAEARREFERVLVPFNRLRQTAKDQVAGYDEQQRAQGSATGTLIGPWLPAPSWWKMDTAVRNAEHVVLERLALGAAVGLFALLTALIAAASAWNAWLAGPDDRPMLFFIGWRRMARVLLVGLVVPLGVYWAFTRLVPFGGLKLGTLQVLGRRLVELGLVYLAASFATLSAAHEAIRRRCLEAGMDVGAPGRLNLLRNVRGGLAAAALAAGMGWAAFGLVIWLRGEVAQETAAACGAVIAVGLFPMLFALWQVRHRGWQWAALEEGLRRLGRGVVPPPVVAAVAVALGFAVLAVLALALPVGGTEAPVKLLVLGAVALPLVYALVRLMQWVSGRLRDRGRVLVSPTTVVAALVALAFAALAALTVATPAGHHALGMLVLVAGGLAAVPLAYALGWLTRSAPPDERVRRFRGTVRRSMVPVLAAGLLALAVVSQTYLRVAEARSLAPLARPELQSAQVDMAAYEEYRKVFTDANREWQAEHAETPAETAAAPATP